MARAAVTLIIVLVGALYYAVAGEDPQIAACQRQVDLVQASYRASPPKADSRKAVENTLKNARIWCGDKKFKDAEAGIEMAAFLCVASKGCQKLLDDAKRQRQSAR
jgi:hypothetical protein